MRITLGDEKFPNEMSSPDGTDQIEASFVCPTAINKTVAVMVAVGLRVRGHYVQ